MDKKNTKMEFSDTLPMTLVILEILSNPLLLVALVLLVQPTCSYLGLFLCYGIMCCWVLIKTCINSTSTPLSCQKQVIYVKLPLATWLMTTCQK